MAEGNDENVTERIRSRYGDEVDPEVTLKSDEAPVEVPGPDTHASELVKRLAGRDVVGRYRLDGEVARGGQGAILRVWDEDLRRNLAMKVTLSTADEGGAQQTDLRTLGRFLEEAQVTGQLDHPGIVPVHELGLDSDGRVYFTMKLVKGRDLRTVFDLVHEGQEGWSQTRALNVLMRVCEAMAYAHAKGVIHRDLKPGNVMVGRYGEVYVMDWGLARVLGAEDRKDIRVNADLMTTGVKSDRRDDADDVESPLLTMDGDVVGTPAYMPPEQAVGDLEAMGPHSDVYAVGAMLYHLLSGQVPYVEPGMRINNRVIWYMVQKEPPTPLTKVEPETPGELVAICEKAMAREPGERYPDMLALAVDLRAFLENRVVGAYRTGALVEFRKWVQRNKGLAATAAAALVFALGGLGATTYIQKKANKDLGEAKAEVDQKNLDLEEAKDLAVFNEEQALWQSYVGNLGAAQNDLARENAALVKLRLERAPEKHRGWEWDYLDLASEQSLTVIGLPDGVDLHDLAYSPDGALLAAAGSDGRIRLWDGETGDARGELAAGEADVTSLAFHPDGSVLASAHADFNVRLWDVAAGDHEVLLAVGERTTHQAPVTSVEFDSTGTRLATRSGTEAGLWSLPELERVAVLRSFYDLAFSPDGTRLATPRPGTTDWGATVADLVLYDAATGEELSHVLSPGFDGQVTVLEFSPDGRRIAIGGVGNISVWDTSKKSVSWSGSQGYREPFMHRVAWSPDGSHVVSAHTDLTLCLWDAESGDQLAVSRLHGNATPYVEFLPGGNRFVTASFDSTIGVWEGPGRARARGGSGFEILGRLEGHAGWITNLAVRPDGEALATSADDGTVRLWSSRTREAWTDVDAGAFAKWVVAYDPSGNHIVSRGHPGDANGNWPLVFWDARSGGEVRRSYCLDAPAHDLEFFPDGESLLVSASSGGVRRIEPGTGDVLDLMADPKEGVREYVAVSPDGSSFAWSANSEGGDVRLRHVGSLETLDLTGHEDRVVGLAFSANGRELYSVTTAGRLRVWGTEEGQELVVVDVASGGAEGPWDIAASPDGRTLAVGGGRDDRNVTLIDREELSLRRLGGHNNAVTSVAFLPDGKRLVTGSFDQTVRVWDVETGDPLLTLDGGDKVLDVAVSPDGQRIAASGGIVRVFHTALDQALAMEVSTPEREAELDRALGWDLNRDVWQIVGGNTPSKNEEDYAQALEWARAAAALIPDSQNVHHTLGFAYYRRGLADQALEAWFEADTLPEDTLARYRLDSGAYAFRSGLIAQDPDAPAEALDAVMLWGERALELAPDDPALRARVADTYDYIARGTFFGFCAKNATDEFALLCALRAAELQSEVVQYWNTLGFMRARLNQLDEAYQAWKEADSRGSFVPDALNARAAWIVMFPDRPHEEYASALGWALEATEASPDVLHFKNTLGVAYYRLGRFEEALKTLQHADALNREQGAYNRAFDLLCIALIQAELGRDEQARATYDEGRALVAPDKDPELDRYLAEAEALFSD